jgi:acyl-coenzyme A thioesterase PaaI-like protein
MSIFASLIKKAQTSRFYLWLLNRVLRWKIPFNAAHGLKITSMEGDTVEVLLPYRRSNCNHLRGMHACALATAGEFAAGIRLLSAVEATRYRLIMTDLQVEYLKQGRETLTASCTLSDEWLQSEVMKPLSEAHVAVVKVESSLTDSKGQTICKVRTTWQIKQWTSFKGR